MLILLGFVVVFLILGWVLETWARMRRAREVFDAVNAWNRAVGR